MLGEVGSQVRRGQSSALTVVFLFPARKTRRDDPSIFFSQQKIWQDRLSSHSSSCVNSLLFFTSHFSPLSPGALCLSLQKKENSDDIKSVPPLRCALQNRTELKVIVGNPRQYISRCFVTGTARNDSILHTSWTSARTKPAYSIYQEKQSQGLLQRGASIRAKR